MTVTADRVEAPLAQAEDVGPGRHHAGDPAALRRRELAGFLRSRRERIAPEQLGLPNGTRRRTPGLRREEVAQVAGVGVTWYTWLEQGRDIHVSEQVLDAIARTLLLDPHEQAHLYTLAGSPLAQTESDCQVITPEVRTVLAKLDPYPACVLNGRFDILAFNRGYLALVGDLDALPFDERNNIWLAFTSPVMRESLVDWDKAVHRMVGQYRAAMADHVAEPAWKCLVKRLQEASPEFAALWRRHDVVASENLTKRYRHPELGRLELNYTSLWLAQRIGTRIMTYTPANDETRRKIERIEGIEPRPLYPRVTFPSAGARFPS